MRKEYIKPEAELMKFVETEEVMITDPQSWQEMMYGTMDEPDDMNWKY